jgi:glycosyltransferase involved in cell wall biosynthesis
VRLVWFSHFVPYPPKGGNLQRSYNLIRQASRSHQVTLVALNFLGESPERLRSHTDELKKYCDRVEIWEVPYQWRGLRWQLEALASPFFRDPFSCRALYSKELCSRWEQILREHPGALLHFDSIDLALYALSARDFRKVLNHHNCESALAWRRAQQESNLLKKAFLSLQARKLVRMEQSICAQFDSNLVVSEEDGALLRVNQPRTHTHVVENGVDIGYFQPSSVQEEFETVAFTGMLNWYPNISGMCFFVREIWPLVKKSFAGSRLSIAGKRPSGEILELARKDSSITVVQNPDDMRPILARSAVVIVPLLDGGGTRLKILDAMAMGKAVVSTTIGCEGLRVTQGENIIIADSPRDFAERICFLFASIAHRARIGSAARVLVEREYSWDKIGRDLEHAYACAIGQSTRARNEEGKSMRIDTQRSDINKK